MPVQFTGNPILHPAIARCGEIEVDDDRLRLLRRVDLLHEKLLAGADLSPPIETKACPALASELTA